MVTIIKRRDLADDRVYEPPAVIGFGINSDTIKNPRITVGHFVMPPGGKSQRHYHANCDAMGYLIRGKVREFVGPVGNIKPVDVEAGDFYFFPKGEIHKTINLSKTEPVEVIFIYPGVNNKEEAGTVFLEPPEE